MNTIKNLLSESMQQMGMIESLSVGTVILSFAVAFLCAALIYVVYRYFYKGVSYSPSFGMLLIMLTLLTNFIILCISTNLVLSLGMVGALSIVRFRAAVKEPLDVGFLFFAIAAGLTSGARLYFIAIIGTLLVDLVFILCYLLLNGTASYLLVIRYGDEAAEALEEALYEQKKKLKSKIKRGSTTEITYAVSLKKDSGPLVDNLSGITGVKNVVLVQYNQEA
ncbi:MAG: DUF4956 domain-containing protein [Lachnospiraceae bacterium]|nr:DUF4956 domain-containing protein [Lachnospiraceae bacterium]MCI9675161.1 DUF4956 domain-containing protein [Lachnospiraceae bacterium]